MDANGARVLHVAVRRLIWITEAPLCRCSGWHDNRQEFRALWRRFGKGDRERLVPIGEEAMDALKEFCDGLRGEILLERQTTWD